MLLYPRNIYGSDGRVLDHKKAQVRCVSCGVNVLQFATVYDGAKTSLSMEPIQVATMLATLSLAEDVYTSHIISIDTSYLRDDADISALAPDKTMFTHDVRLRAIIYRCGLLGIHGDCVRVVGEAFGLIGFGGPRPPGNLFRDLPGFEGTRTWQYVAVSEKTMAAWLLRYCEFDCRKEGRIVP